MASDITEEDIKALASAINAPFASWLKSGPTKYFPARPIPEGVEFSLDLDKLE